MAPLTPHWAQPSHPDIQEVVFGEGEFSSKSLSRTTLAPFGLFAELSFPPCTVVEESSYATVQISRDQHIYLNSDLLYLNHSCEPSLIIDTDTMQILVGPKGLKPGDELTFFYPSTEWHMAQPFRCQCQTPSCRGLISGARDMTPSELEGYWLSGHIRKLLSEQQQQPNGNGAGLRPEPPVRRPSAVLPREDPTVRALQEALEHAEKVVVAAKTALVSYVEFSSAERPIGQTRPEPGKELNGK